MMAGVLGIFSMISAQDCEDLFISEYLEGSGNNKGLEIYNPTPDIINTIQNQIRFSGYIQSKNTNTRGHIKLGNIRFIPETAFLSL